MGENYYWQRRRTIYNVYFVPGCRVMGSVANLILIHGYVLSAIHGHSPPLLSSMNIILGKPSVNFPQ